MAQLEVDRWGDQDGERGDDPAIARLEGGGEGDLGSGRIAHEDRVGTGLPREVDRDLCDGHGGAALGTSGYIGTIASTPAWLTRCARKLQCASWMPWT